MVIGEYKPLIWNKSPLRHTHTHPRGDRPRTDPTRPKDVPGARSAWATRGGGMVPRGERDGGGVRLHGGGRLEEARRVLGPRPMGEGAGHAMGGRRPAGPMGTGPGGVAGDNAGLNGPLFGGKHDRSTAASWNSLHIVWFVILRKVLKCAECHHMLTRAFPDNNTWSLVRFCMCVWIVHSTVRTIKVLCKKKYAGDHNVGQRYIHSATRYNIHVD